MRSSACVASLILLALSACDNKQDAQGSGSAPSATTPSPSSAPSSAGAAGGSASAPSSEGSAPKPLSSLNMPERPIPKPQNTVGAGMPIEVQQKAIAYMVAMRAPRPDDANAEPDFANDLAQKLRSTILSMDTGSDKAKMNRVEVIANGRQIDLLMAAGCDAKTPFRAVVQRVGVPLATLVSHGVFVVRCNDERVQCLQSTRDPDDVLCTTAPRHK